MGVLSEEMKRVVREQRLGYVATVGKDGAPYVSPKGSLTVLDDDTLAFADVESPHTVLNLSEDPRTEINVVDPFIRKGYRFRGRGKILRTGTQYWNVLEMYHAEGADVRRIRSVVIVELESATPLVSPVYILGAPEEEIRSLWEEYHTKRKARTLIDLVPPRDF
ncbi:MAG: pyridoxamine 5'-phosphate oxidase family protein [Thermoplasmata archaeon]|nr:pyridoxamine 5'-phosphate oxidase family protein [Thermoplasmata archaeon]